MQSHYDYRKFAVLYVDDEEKSLKYFKLAFEGKFRILTASSVQEGYEILQKHADEIGILMTDQRMPEATGVELLEKARGFRPKIVRILATAYSDIGAAIQAVNTGAIYKYVTKPWDVAELETTLRRALEFFTVQRERDQLLHEKLSVIHHMMIADRLVAMGVMAAGLGHHIRNAMVAIKTFVDLAPRKLQQEEVNFENMRDPEFWVNFYKQVRLQIDRISQVLGNLSEISEGPRFSFPDQVQLGETVEKALNEFAEDFKRKGIVVLNEIPATLPRLRVDGVKFQRLFQLLIQYQIENLPQNGKMIFKAQQSAGTVPSVGLEIWDNGHGLPLESVQAMFDPMYVCNVKLQELGVNLMACYFIVHHHGGTIEISHPNGEGTSLILRFPTDAHSLVAEYDESTFLRKVLFNEKLLEKLISNSPQALS